jgi:hypothetical protein
MARINPSLKLRHGFGTDAAALPRLLDDLQSTLHALQLQKLARVQILAATKPGQVLQSRSRNENVQCTIVERQALAVAMQVRVQTQFAINAPHQTVSPRHISCEWRE